MSRVEPLHRTTWGQKFGYAFRGMKRGIRGESSFFVHFFIAAAVIVAALVLRVTLAEWGLLILCIAGVLAAEMFNSALENLAKAVTGEYQPRIEDALDISSAAVLIACIGASIVGTLIFVNRLGVMLMWWE